MDSSLLALKTPAELAVELGDRLRTLRLGRNWTRRTLASRAGVTEASLKRFERTGKASLELLLEVALALDRLDELDGLFHPVQARSMAELEEQASLHARKRGRR
ncbi:MAG: helix-turn-helix domain-containing protein [Polyangia bacterium]|jgi:transcriptional regulator with XRE-family HTH domain|nr:helix-turn-helix domain-containing protein [Polyangia bacterium]